MSSVDEIEAALRAEDPERRRRGVQRIPDLSSPMRPRFLLLALGDDDWRVRKEAVAISLELGASEDLVRELVLALGPGDNVGLRNAAVETLAAFGGPAIVALGAALDSLDADGRKLAVEALGRAHDLSALPLLEQLASDADANVRVAVMDAIAEVGGLSRESAMRVLMAGLLDAEVHVRLSSLGGLQRLKAVVPWERLEPLTLDPMLRASALALAARSSDARAAVSLSAALDDERRSLFAVAVTGLAELVQSGQVSVTALRERLAEMGPRARERLLEAAFSFEEDEAHRAALVVLAVAEEERAIDATLDAFLGERSSREAALALRIFGSRARSRILARIEEGSEDARAACVSLIVSLVPHEGDEAVTTALRAAIRDESPIVAGAALLALATLGEGDDLATVAALVASSHPRIATAAEAALASLAVRHPESARAFVRESMEDERAHTAAAVAIGASSSRLSGHLDRDLAFLDGVLSGPDTRARRAAVMAVGDIGAAAGLPLLLRALDDASRDVRLASISALGELRTSDGQPAGTGPLLALLLRESEDREIVVAALGALGRTGDGEVASAIVPYVGSPSPAVAVAAVTALGRIDDMDGLPALLEAARSEEAEVVKAALLALDGSSHPAVVACFGKALEHERWDVRTLAADCLGPSGAAASVELIRARLSRETEPIVREALDRALDLACRASESAKVANGV